MKQHHYQLRTEWSGNLGEGTTTYEAYSRDYSVSSNGKPTMLGSSDPHFRGDATRWNPEDMMVSSVSSCHMLWYLHLCAVAGVVIESYIDDSSGVMEETTHGGKFVSVTLKPAVTISADSSIDIAQSLHAEAHRYCFIANSVNFPIHIEAEITKSG